MYSGYIFNTDNSYFKFHCNILFIFSRNKNYIQCYEDIFYIKYVDRIQIIIYKMKDNEHLFSVIVKATNGPRYVVGCRRQLDKNKLKSGTRVALDMTTLTIMRYLPREVKEFAN